MHPMFLTIAKSNENKSENCMHGWNQDPVPNGFGKVQIPDHTLSKVPTLCTTVLD